MRVSDWSSDVCSSDLAAGVRFADNQFGLDVLAGKNPFGVHDRAALAQYFDILFHDRRALPPMPWPAPAILIGHRRREAAFEQSVLDEIGRGPEQFLPGEIGRASCRERVCQCV